MVIYSELTGKTYETVDECLGDEHKFKKDKEAEEKAKKEYEEKVEKAYQDAIEACDYYLNLVGLGIEEETDDNDYHITLTWNDEEIDLDDELIEKLIDFLLD